MCEHAINLAQYGLYQCQTSTESVQPGFSVAAAEREESYWFVMKQLLKSVTMIFIVPFDTSTGKD